MTDPDPHPDSAPEDDNDRRSDLEREVSGGGEDVEGMPGHQDTPLEPTGMPDGNAGTGGMTKNQEDLAQ